MIHQSAKFFSLRGRVNTANHLRHQHVLFLSTPKLLQTSALENVYFVKIRKFLTNTVDYDVENNTCNIQYFDLVRTSSHALLLLPD